MKIERSRSGWPRLLEFVAQQQPTQWNGWYLRILEAEGRLFAGDMARAATDAREAVEATAASRNLLHRTAARFMAATVLAWSGAREEAAALVEDVATSSMREEEFVRLDGISHRSFEKSLRSLLDKQLSLPTLRVDQWIRFAPLPANAARVLGLEAGQPGFVMELRGYTLRDRPLSYQCLFSGPFSERFVVVR